MVVSPDKFKIIFKCEITKEAWDILEVTYEGTKTMKIPNTNLKTWKDKNAERWIFLMSFMQNLMIL